MKKITILKSLVDFIWIVTCIPLVLAATFFIFYQFFDNKILQIFYVKNENMIEPDIGLHVFVILFAVLVFACIYAFYLYRQTLRYFQQKKPFDNFVINTYTKIGKILLTSGMSITVLIFIYNLIYKNELILSVGLSPYLVIILLGLFFMVLSETFSVAKITKEENDLTI